MTEEMWGAVLTAMRVGMDVLENIDGDPEQEKWENVLRLARQAYPMLEAYGQTGRE